ncbi:histidine--tRNA ligase [bacterium]|nr:histidine--tRNA ligase [bacterium]
MASLITAQRGTRDVLPPESLLWNKIEETARSFFARYHVLEVRTPIFEATELFTRGIGEATDIVSKEMYSFVDRGDRSITLRPEGTAGVVRAYLQGKLASTMQGPVKLWYAGPMFRYERPQAGRQRQFNQIGVEVLGTSDPKADAEVITLALDIFAALSVSNLRVELNSLGCEDCRPAYRERLVAYFAERQADYCTTCLDRMETNPLRVLDCKVPACKDLNREAPSLQDVLCEGCREHQAKLFGYLDAVGVKHQLNPRLVRGLDYYTRTVFEIVAEEKLGSQDTVCAGGRYDKLVEECGGPPTPAVGWAFGEERLAILLEASTPKDAIDLYVAAMGPEAEVAGFKLAHGLRNHGDWRIECGFGDRKLKKQLEVADKLGAQWVAIIGEAELEAGEIQLKNLAARTTQTVAMDAESLAAALTAALPESGS